MYVLNITLQDIIQISRGLLHSGENKGTPITTQCKHKQNIVLCH